MTRLMSKQIGTISSLGGGGNISANSVIFPSVGPAAATARNGHPLVAFDDTASESVLFEDTVTMAYHEHGLKVYIYWTAVAVSGSVVWSVEVERIAAGSNISSSAFQPPVTVVSQAPSGSWVLVVAEITITNAEAGGLLPGDACRYRLSRQPSSPSDTMAGDALMFRVVVQENV
jgi:hypothetical protein